MNTKHEEKEAKKQLYKLLIILAVLWLLTSVVVYVKSLFAENSVYLTDVEKMNKFYAEENIKSEMNFLAMKHYMDNISIEEYIETFFVKGE